VVIALRLLIEIMVAKHC